MDYTIKKDCRCCASKRLKKFLSLDNMPLPNAFLTDAQLKKKENKYPLDVCFCLDCGMVQLAQVVDAPAMFNDYAYFTGASDPIKKHFDDMVEDVVSGYKVKEGSLVVDIGSNDGTLLQSFKNRGMEILGVEPAVNIAEYANKHEIETLRNYFNAEVARYIIKEKEQPMVITATNVFAHVDNLMEFVRCVKMLLDKDGVFIVEVPYLSKMISKVEFDTIYHEHLSYFSVMPLVILFGWFNMSIVEIELVNIHGGSIRVHIKNGKDITKVTNSLAFKEIDARLNRLDPFFKFGDKVKSIKNDLKELLVSIKKTGSRIVGYGAAAKGNTLLNYCKIGTDLVDYIADTTPYKQGLYTPGMHIPVYSFDRYYQDPPKYTLMLAWNYADDILKKESRYRDNGGKFIIPIPSPRIV